MLEIIGGAYLERCLEPDRNELYGSGLRAAAAVSDLTKVRLHCYVDRAHAAGLAANAASYGVVYRAAETPQTVSFTYSHPLATPIIRPTVGHIAPSPDIEVRGRAVLRFGMLEGSGRVTAKRVVYDPQSPFDPRPFHENGSTAEDLAIVSNGREASLLAGRSEPDSIAKHLIKAHKAAVVVIKRGPHGALIYDGSKRTSVPAYHTDRVWKIGSGDVFAATFATYWADKGLAAHDAAGRASAAAATYCGRQAIPLPRDFHRAVLTELKPIRVKAKPGASPPMVYLAGPFFTMAERWLVAEARTALLQQGVRVFSPFHDVGHGTADDVVPADLKALDRCSAVFAIADGTDAGTLFEVGYATAQGTPVVAFAQNEHGEALKMLQGSRCRICDDFASAIYNTVWAALQR